MKENTTETPYFFRYCLWSYDLRIAGNRKLKCIIITSLFGLWIYRVFPPCRYPRDKLITGSRRVAYAIGNYLTGFTIIRPRRILLIAIQSLNWNNLRAIHTGLRAFSVLKQRETKIIHELFNIYYQTWMFTWALFQSFTATIIELSNFENT